MTIQEFLLKIKSFFDRLKNKNFSSFGHHLIKKKQYKNLALVIFGLFGIILLIVLMKHHGQDQLADQSESQGQNADYTLSDNHHKQEISFTSNLNHVDQQSVWIQRAENKLDDQMQAQKDLAEQENNTKTQVNEQGDLAKTQQQQIAELNQQLADLKNQVDAGRAEDQKRTQEEISRMVRPANGEGGNYYGGPQMVNTPIHLTPKPKLMQKLKKTPETYVPPGAYVTAAVLQGVDASAGVTSQSDPRPVLLRTISNGVLPGDYKSHLKNCLIVGSGYGDASSERVYVRLETMSCTRHGEEVDYPVYGYISGTDAKTGQHGQVVFRDGPFVERAFVGGFLNGIGNVGQQYSQNASTSALGTVSSIDPKKIPLAGAAGGVGTAGQMYAQYNIQRAEQYQPVVEFSAGNVIDVVFTKGFWLDGHVDKNNGENNPDNSQVNAQNSSDNSSSNSNGSNADQNLSDQMNQISKE